MMAARDQVDWAERRNSERKRTLLQGRVVFNSRFSTIECIVKDLSGTGAQIAFEHPTEIPRQVELEVPSKGLTVQAEVRWSKDKRHGLMFLNAGSAASAKPAQADPYKEASSAKDMPSLVPKGAAQEHGIEGWILAVLPPGDPSRNALFAVAEPDGKEALAILLQQCGVTPGNHFEPVGRLSGRAVQMLSLSRGQCIDLSS